MAAPKTCTQCQKDNSAVWRTDRETKAILCNACYLKKYPRPSRQASVEAAQDSSKENGSAPKRQKVIELKTTGDPVAQLAKEAEKENVHIKMELTEEIKLEEVKQEVKEEMDLKEEPVDDALHDIFGDAMQVKEKKKRKHTESSVITWDNGAPPDVECHSDSEYAEVDLSSTAPSLVVEASGKSLLDGRYDRMTKACRGRPCYYRKAIVKDATKMVYMYWQADKWKAGSDFGAPRSLARIPSVEGLLDCFEPYPHSWQVYGKVGDAATGTYQDVPAFRVFDTRNLEHQPQLPEPLMEAVSFSADGTAAGASGQEVSDRKREKKEKKEKKEEKKETVQDIKQEKPEEAEVKKEEAPSTDSSSESSSASSDSSGGAGAAQDGNAPGSPAKADPEAERAQQEAKRAEAEALKLKKASHFEKKLRMELEKISDAKARNKKLETITNMLNARKDSLVAAAGMTPDKIAILIADLARDFGNSREAAKKAPRPPAAAPPGHLLKDGSNSIANAMPSTPPDNAAGAPNEPNHRTAAPTRGVLKTRRGGANMDIRMSTVAAFPLIDKVMVSSFRLAGESLWFQAPGSVVSCDRCERGVPQTMGALQGAPGSSQFAQCEFFCSDCIAGAMVMPG